MNEETLKTYHKIDAEIWRLFRTALENIQPTTEYLDIAAGKFVEYEQLWKYTKFWQYAGQACSAKLQEIERLWKELRGEQSEQNNQV